MCLLIETIRVINGNAENLSWHNKRMNAARRELFGTVSETDLALLLKIPEEYRKGEIKCRLRYGHNIEKIEFEPYSFRPVHGLKIVHDNTINYSFKFLDRSVINSLFAQKEDLDDILIVKNGFITDSSYCNLVFTDGNGLFTPASPLLRGTKREKYISEGTISEKEIRIEDLHNFREIHMINTFLELGRCVVKTNDVH